MTIADFGEPALVFQEGPSAIYHCRVYHLLTTVNFQQTYFAVFELSPKKLLQNWRFPKSAISYKIFVQDRPSTLRKWRTKTAVLKNPTVANS